MNSISYLTILKATKEANMKIRFLILTILFAAACSSSPKEETPVAATGSKSAVESAKDSKKDEPKKEESGTVSADLQKELHKVAQLAKTTDNKNASEPAASDNHGSHSKKKGHAKKPVDPEMADKALRWLKNGNTRFLRSSLRKDGQSKKDIKRLSEGQSPHSIIVSCSDSRVPPEVIFDQRLGELFVVRTAGQSFDHNMVASVEYAIEHLGSKLIVVMGHTKCGAVKASLETMDGADAGSPSLNHLVQDIQPRIKSVANKSNGPLYEKEAWANADGVAADLINKSTIIKKAVGSGEVKVVIGLYHMDNGKVEFAE
jgi:carbonic anhydrase